MKRNLYPSAALAAAMASFAALIPAPSAAQSQAPPKLVIYGDQKCPTDRDGNEVIVCERRSKNEQFRIPKELREFQITPENESWAVRAQGVANDSTVAGGIGSCSTVGPGGQSGCFLQQARQQKAENQARKSESARVQESLP